MQCGQGWEEAELAKIDSRELLCQASVLLACVDLLNLNINP